MERPNPPVEASLSSQERSPVTLPSAQTIYEQVQRENAVVLGKITIQPRYASEERFAQRIANHNEKNGIIDRRRAHLIPGNPSRLAQPLQHSSREESAA